jgi:hypothetical protein
MSLMVPGTLLYSGYREEASAPPGSRLTCAAPVPRGWAWPAKEARVERQRYLAGRNATWSSKATPATGWNE